MHVQDTRWSSNMGWYGFIAQQSYSSCSCTSSCCICSKTWETAKTHIHSQHVRIQLELHKDKWNNYIEQSPIADENTKLKQLQAACDDELKQRIFDSGNYSSLNTTILFLAKMKELAVITVHQFIWWICGECLKNQMKVSGLLLPGWHQQLTCVVWTLDALLINGIRS